MAQVCLKLLLSLGADKPIWSLLPPKCCTTPEHYTPSVAAAGSHRASGRIGLSRQHEHRSGVIIPHPHPLLGEGHSLNKLNIILSFDLNIAWCSLSILQKDRFCNFCLSVWAESSPCEEQQNVLYPSSLCSTGLWHYLKFPPIRSIILYYWRNSDASMVRLN